MAEEFKFEVTKQLGTLSEGSWNMEINMVSYNGATPKLDIRKWSAEHDKMGKGVTLTEEEYLNLKDILESIPNPFKKTSSKKHKKLTEDDE